MHSRDSAAEWFLRLNGFLTVLNFVVHPVTPEEGSVQRTDADVLGIRFPDRQEVVGGKPLEDHPKFQNAPHPLFVIAEVKTARCRLNGPWTRQRNGNVTNVLRSFGRMSPTKLQTISEALYGSGHFQSDGLDVRLVCFGATRNQNLQEGVLQFTWEEIFGFIFDRYQTFWRSKCQHKQWPQIGHFFWEESRIQEREPYVRSMLRHFRVAE